jgi:multidrug efflux pump subunit AcrA (membrane-fusion protein)
VGYQSGGVDPALGGVNLADFATLVVEADVSEARLHLVKAGGPAEIVLDAFPQRRLRGKALAVLPRVNRAKATVTVRVGFTDEPQGVLPEMAARVSFLSAALDAESIKQPPKTIVPGSAVTERAGAKVVFMAEDGRARMRSIEVGPAFGNGFELVRGPAPGARLIKDPPSELTDGQRIKERTEE